MYKGFNLVKHRSCIRICDTSDKYLQTISSLKAAKQTVDFWVRHGLRGVQ